MTATPGHRNKVADFGPRQLPDFLGLDVWQFELARRLGLVPPPDVDDRRWSVTVANQLAAQTEDIAARVGADPPIGARRSAERLADRTGVDVEAADVDQLADSGQLEPVGGYKGWPLYPTAQLDALEVALVAAVVAERHAWMDASLTRWDAADRLGLHVRDFEKAAQDQQVTTGHLGRYSRTDVDRLAADEQLMERIAADQLLGPNQAAQHLEIRRRDFDYVTAAGWVAPKRYVSMPVGYRSTVSVPLYRAGDLDALKGLPEVDWEQVSAAKPGDPSPLRRFARLPETRATVIRRFVAQVADRWDIEVFAYYQAAGASCWELDWLPDRREQPTVSQVEAMLTADTSVRHHRDSITLGTDAGAAIRWAREMLEPDAAVILDTETTDLPGAICEIAVIDAHTGDTLLDTLVNPGEPISPGAAMVHGISEHDLDDAPTWPEVLPQLLKVTRGRTVLAYNADFDHDVILSDCHRHDLDAGHLAHQNQWSCVMGRRSDWLRAWHRLALDGGHRALGDTHAARAVLHDMTQPAHQPPRPGRASRDLGAFHDH